MTQKYLSLALTAAAFCFCTNLAKAYEHVADRPAQPASKASASISKTLTKQSLVKVKPGPKVKLVDVNSVNKAALKKLPGITDADADKIIANRPYGSKAWLVTHNVIPEKTYHGLSALIQAGQAPLVPSKKANQPAKK